MPPINARAIQAVIFDMDGVLLDSEPLHWAAMNQALGAAGAPVDEDEYRGYIGDTVHNAWTAILARRGLDTPLAPYLVRYSDAVCAVVAAEAQPMPGLLPLLADLHAAGVPLAVGSTSPRRWVTVTVAALGVRDYFAAVVSGEDVAHPKPAPDIFLCAATLLGIPPAACLVIEDSPRGLAAARAAGMAVAGLQHPATAFAAPFPPTAADLVVPSLAAFHTWWTTNRD